VLNRYNATTDTSCQFNSKIKYVPHHTPQLSQQLQYCVISSQSEPLVHHLCTSPPYSPV